MAAITTPSSVLTKEQLRAHYRRTSAEEGSADPLSAAAMWAASLVGEESRATPSPPPAYSPPQPGAFVAGLNSPFASASLGTLPVPPPPPPAAAPLPFPASTEMQAPSPFEAPGVRESGGTRLSRSALISSISSAGEASPPAVSGLPVTGSMLTLGRPTAASPHSSSGAPVARTGGIAGAVLSPRSGSKVGLSASVGQEDKPRSRRAMREQQKMRGLMTVASPLAAGPGGTPPMSPAPASPAPQPPSLRLVDPSLSQSLPASPMPQPPPPPPPNMTAPAPQPQPPAQSPSAQSDSREFRAIRLRGASQAAVAEANRQALEAARQAASVLQAVPRSPDAIEKERMQQRTEQAALESAQEVAARLPMAPASPKSPRSPRSDRRKFEIVDTV